MKQETKDNALAIQSGRDTVINSGISPEQMSTILAELARLLPTFVDQARDMVDKRLNEFRAQLLPKFVTPEADPQAFSDPDFQYVLTRAQNAYARSGDPDLASLLVDMIAERSMQKDRSRLTLSLNAAIEVAADLSPNEFAELSLVFVLKYTIYRGFSNLDGFCGYFRRYIEPFLKQISRSRSSYQYLEAKQCASIEFGHVELARILNHSYCGVFQSGCNREEIAAELPQDKKGLLDNTDIIIPCSDDPGRLQFNALNEEDLRGRLEPFGLQKDLIERLVSQFFGVRAWGIDALKEKLAGTIPSFLELAELWDARSAIPIDSLTLTSTGIAIAYCNLKRVVPDFKADLSIWIN